MISPGNVRTAPAYGADIVTKLAAGARVRHDSGIMVSRPTGMAVIVGETPALTQGYSGPRSGDTLELLGYLAPGVSRVRWHGQEFATITHDGGQPVPWLQILREPVQYWWLFITDSASRQSGWMRIGGMRANANEDQTPSGC